MRRAYRQGVHRVSRSKESTIVRRLPKLRKGLGLKLGWIIEVHIRVELKVHSMVARTHNKKHLELGCEVVKKASPWTQKSIELLSTVANRDVDDPHIWSLRLVAPQYPDDRFVDKLNRKPVSWHRLLGVIEPGVLGANPDDWPNVDRITKGSACLG